MATSCRFSVAVHVLTYMAWSDTDALKSDKLALSVNTNPVVIRRLMCALSRAKLVTSQSGSTGGSRLARRPSHISLLDVYRAVEDAKAFGLHHRPPNRRCPIGREIETVLEDVLDRVDLAVESTLARTTIADVLQSMQCSFDKTFERTSDRTRVKAKSVAT
ncbi:MAG: Rrf2 family transcriptional regulator [Pyrinomonadaceae bacterium]